MLQPGLRGPQVLLGAKRLEVATEREALVRGQPQSAQTLKPYRPAL